MDLSFCVRMVIAVIDTVEGHLFLTVRFPNKLAQRLQNPDLSG
jgi:hypothetical protein